MAQSTGSKAVITFGEESTFGTVATAGINLLAIDCSVNLQQNLIESRVLTGTRNPQQPALDEKSVSGSLTVQPDPTVFGWLLKHAIGAPTTSGVGPYTHVFKVADLPTSFSLEKYFSDNAIALQYLGCRFNGFSLDVGSGGILEASFDVLGQDQTNLARFDSSPTVVAPVPLRNASVALTEGGSAFAKALRFSLQYGNNIEPTKTVGNAGKIYALPEGMARPSGTLSILFDSMTTLNKALNATETALSLTWTAGTHSLAIEIPEVRYAVTSPPITGPGGIVVDLAFQGYYEDDADASAIIATLVNAQANYTSIT
jgi:hypothetical protein